ncbi:hypothetical protein TUMEXPCC7403_22755 [Tumidithrix helvetica PCC 7403]
MVQAATKFLTANEFIRDYGDRYRHELIDGELNNLQSRWG